MTNYTPFIIVSETRYYKDLFHMFIGFIVVECLAVGVALLVRSIV